VKYKVVPVTPFEQNCSVLWCEDTMKGAVIDPGGDLDRILAVAEAEGVELEKILITHGHLDHAAATADLAEKLSIPIEGPNKGDDFWIEGLPLFCQQYGFPPARPFQPTRWLNDGDDVAVGNLALDVLHCPGHTPGHVVFFHAPSKTAWVGDVLFAGSIGRTDFPRGNFEDLIRSITGRLWPLGDDVEFVPGHGPNSTFGRERQANPFVADSETGYAG
jgi:glyoxylase-like metal-dependent hydrolase (beta-lactamase superfamily II)